MRWSDDAGTESSGEEYMEEVQPKFKAQKAGHKGGLEERCATVLAEQRHKEAKSLTMFSRYMGWAFEFSDPAQTACSGGARNTEIQLRCFPRLA